ncbi:MAG: biopolymer transporter ExbD, partial [Gemmataceae bacterium]|nr:biopolymer transporter ExbD [Gemmataceae bacterium]
VGAGVAAARAVAPGPAEVPEPADQDAAFRSDLGTEDDEVDMIPLIDISMVLLVFFIIISATGALSPVDVPDMRYAGNLEAVADSITMTIERGGPDEVYYTVREGQAAAKPENARLKNDVEALAALDAIVAERTRPPEVRLACAKDLPSDRVLELSRELKKRADKNRILTFLATVNEAPQKE